MRKAIYISILLMNFWSAAQAQKKFIYQDSSLLQKEEEEIITVPAEDFETTDTSLVQAPVAITEEQPADTALYRNDLDISYDSVKNWRNLKEYAYAKNLDSLLKALKKKKVEEPALPKRGTSLFSNLLGSGLLKLLLWAVAICFVIFILYRLFLAEGAFKRKTRSNKDSEAEVEEEIITHESDFDKLIRQALQNGNYRQAVRYQYLRTLHQLANKNLVSLAPDKTNFNYVSEITNRDHRDAFAALTLNYEYVWYGEFDIDKNIYDKIEYNFNSLNKKI